MYPMHLVYLVYLFIYTPYPATSQLEKEGVRFRGKLYMAHVCPRHSKLVGKGMFVFVPVKVVLHLTRLKKVS